MYSCYCTYAHDSETLIHIQFQLFTHAKIIYLHTMKKKWPFLTKCLLSCSKIYAKNSQNHRIPSWKGPQESSGPTFVGKSTESQNGWVWKGPLEII